jgi:diaminobutyrate-2-oxoglutarate transaminase
MVLSKAIGGSLPLAVIVYREELDAWHPGAHAGTFRGTQLAMAAGTATIRYVARNALHERAEEVGARVLRRLRGLATHHPCIGDVRGRGLMIGVELVDTGAEPDDHGALPAAPRLAARVQQEALRRGLIIELGGRHSSVVRLLPPLTITDEQAEAVLDRLADAIAAADVPEAGSHGDADIGPARGLDILRAGNAQPAGTP